MMMASTSPPVPLLLLHGERAEHADAARGNGERTRRRVAAESEHAAGGDAGERDRAEQDQEEARLPLQPPAHGSFTRTKTVPCPLTSRVRRITSPPLELLLVLVLPSIAVNVRPPVHASKRPTWSKASLDAPEP